ncbi:helix-turn-helix domain-containing protein, partial [Pseudomonas aeruginosa]|uniref:helix-turn-helix domain-containing protein n=1 Tax=Pseudomonas aeruginosa TaxID=287 RepID=UPI002E8E7441|nr:helix-turn-helix domain-containing protein [Pseudomonas aeruginosa]
MSAPQKAVLISLADNSNDDGVCWPSVAKIAERTCLSERAVRNALRWLEDAKVLVSHPRHGRSTWYTVTPASYAPGTTCPPAPGAAPPVSFTHLRAPATGSVGGWAGLGVKKNGGGGGGGGG